MQAEMNIVGTDGQLIEHFDIVLNKKTAKEPIKELLFIQSVHSKVEIKALINNHKPSNN